MSRLTPGILSAVAAFVGAMPAGTQKTSVTYTAIPREIVESRLDRVSPDPAARQAMLAALFAEAGCTGERLVAQKVKGDKLPNVICSVPGETAATVVIGAHFDHVGIGAGAVDNWSGASMLPSLYASVAAAPRRYRYVFAGFTAEENGLFGSRGFVRQMSKEERRQVRAYINIDCVGLSPAKIWSSRSDKRLNAILAGVARAMRVEVAGIDMDRVGDDDTHSFLGSRIPVLSVHSVTQQTLRILHSPNDVLQAIRRDDYYDTYRLLSAYLAYLDGALE